jgi:FdhD protein
MSHEALPLEAPWVLDANGTRLATGSSTPGDWTALLAGWLLGEGFVRQPGDLLSVQAEPLANGTVRVRALIDGPGFETARAEQQHRHNEGCGLNHFLHCAPDSLRRERPRFALERHDAATLLKSLFAACDEISPEGGVHGAALADGRTLHKPAVDVARHSAVHRAIGAAFLSGADLSQRGLVLTARISGPIALTAARAGLAWVASRSVPTSLAAAIAERAGLPLLARAAGRGAQRFGA